MLFTETHRKIFLIVFVLFGFLWGIGNAPLFDEDEGFFAEGTREMAVRGDFVSTFINKEQRFDKPPLTNWLQYGCAQIFGWNEFSMRLPSCLASVFWMFLIYFFTKKKLDERSAFFATLIAASSIQITIVGKAALADGILNMALTGAMLCLFDFIHQKNKKFIWAFYVFTGIGFLAKGPIAVLIPGAVFMIYLVKWKTWNAILRLLDPIGIFLFLIIAAPWYILEYQASGENFINGFFLNHNVNRFQTAFEGHYGGILYFVPVLLLGLLPFTAVILKSFTKIKYIWSKKWLSFLMIWFCFVFILFSLSGTKLHHYIIYGYSPLCVLGGWYAANNSRLPVVWPALVFIILLIAIPFSVPFAIPKINDVYVVEVLKAVSIEFDQFYLFFMLTIFAILLLVWWIKSWSTEIRMGIVGLMMLITINIIWMPRLGALLQKPVKEAALFAKNKNLKNVVIFNHYNPSFHFYSELYAEEREPKTGEIVFTKTDRLASIPVQEVFYNKYGYILIKVGSK
ncbi:glycosyltransferase family 39 protein [Dyadobacter sp. CY345]|uniref:ArnT family glycosyltransferase n=1 Tax=Dyadobacter sp. CY345 TaxID=2909335 RepID=UPI001F2C95CF|nr:glycosyltransferase family 39 protein [Dyadobacter sp. CY345]MCF2445776.1 glycosyltransferase family 39 protein [Dyadobacter sp. CY345]